MSEVDITGRRLGRLVALRSLGKGRCWQLQWECLCDCGKVVAVDKKKLVSGHTRSCGCLRRDLLKERRHGRPALGHDTEEGAGV